MSGSRTAMARRVARRALAEERDEAMEVVDEAVDAIIASLIVLEENLPRVKTNTVPQKAAIDSVTDLLNEGVKPYFADAVKALQVFEQ